ncbi:MAG: DUF4350 domain-containing protein [Bacteroidetes bacterium]|nr:DUF4350 domain-containing protein [Bacteroidota bacterium]
MIRKYRYHIILGLGFLLLSIAQFTKPARVDWTPTFSKFDKIPYGNYVLFECLPNLFPDSISVSTRPVYNTVRNNDFVSANYIIINSRVLLGSLDTEYLLDWVQKGNDVFMSAAEFSEHLKDTLKFDLNIHISLLSADTVDLNLVQNVSLNCRYNLLEKLYVHYFSKYDSSNAIILGTIRNKYPNFIKIPFGEGSFYLHCTPYVFTNYHLLKDNNHKYASGCLSYLGEKETIWDEYHKKRNIVIAETTQLRGIFARRSLRTAYIVLLGLVFSYAVFRIKRRQRIIPVIESPKNISLQFIKMVGRLYYFDKKNRDLAVKLGDYFLADIREKFGISTSRFDEEFIKKLSALSGVGPDETSLLIKHINLVNSRTEINENILIKLESLIHKFNKTSLR